MKLLLILCFSGCFLFSFSQDKNQFYALDKNMNQTVLDSSKYILWIHKKEDSNWQWDYYYTWGPLVKSNSYADHDGTIKNGQFYLYNSNGNLDSTGIFDHGKKNGWFSKYRSYTNDSIRAIYQYKYQDDSLVKFVDVTEKKEKAKDTTDMKEPEFPDGLPGWYNYLRSHLVYPERAISKEVQGQVQVAFIVDTNGVVKDLFLQKSVEYSIDQASLDLIKKSGEWKPATNKGLPVKSYKMQPINFKLEAK
jgi:periplasmic protein TonB